MIIDNLLCNFIVLELTASEILLVHEQATIGMLAVQCGEAEGDDMNLVICHRNFCFYEIQFSLSSRPRQSELLRIIFSRRCQHQTNNPNSTALALAALLMEITLWTIRVILCQEVKCRRWRVKMSRLPAGHSFWDTETWMFPFFVLFDPSAARATLDYRIAHLQPARDRAADTGYEGARCLEVAI